MDGRRAVVRMEALMGELMRGRVWREAGGVMGRGGLHRVVRMHMGDGAPGKGWIRESARPAKAWRGWLSRVRASTSSGLG